MSDNIYIVYKTTNLVNGKFYIGVHKINGKGYYLGSGKALKYAIKKHGRDNFTRKTLFIFDNNNDAYKKEADIVDEELLKNKMCYNMVIGGGYGPILYGKDHPMYGKPRSKSTKKKISKINKGRKQTKKEILKRSRSLKGHIVTEETRKKISEGNKGKSKSEQHIKKISKKCVINNIRFNSCTKASKYFKVAPSSITNWCKNIKKENCYYV